MIFETAITRQAIPTETYYKGNPTTGIDRWRDNLKPPTSHGDWRFREFKILDSIQFMPGYTVTGGVYSVPPTTSVPQCEILVIWERVSSIKEEDDEE